MKIQKSNWLCQTDLKNRVRFFLGENGPEPLICIGVNPSTAGLDELDPTMRAVKRHSLQKNYSGWIMLNLYPQRATDPNRIHKRINRELHRQNLLQIGHILEQYPHAPVWAAWGNLIEKRSFLIPCLRDILHQTDILSNEWICMGDLTKAGHPRHPLYLPKSASVNSFYPTQYIRGQLPS
ncbi:MAG: DUF1643 domain-containing protein [Saprospirales bacterium]|nr:MAG: DUF1643 domain-containing protein [Saprospirales bacterium]